MKCITLLLLAGAICFCGCARRYTITTNSGSQIAARGKPKLDNGYYVFKDEQGQPARVPAGRVREISPSSMATRLSDRYPGAK